jgi:hypothetical protein
MNQVMSVRRAPAAGDTTATTRNNLSVGIAILDQRLQRVQIDARNDRRVPCRCALRVRG